MVGNKRQADDLITEAMLQAGAAALCARDDEGFGHCPDEIVQGHARAVFLAMLAAGQSEKEPAHGRLHKQTAVIQAGRPEQH